MHCNSQLFVGVQDDLDDLDMDDDNIDHMNDDQGSADHDSDMPTVASNGTKDDALSCFRSHTGSVLTCMLFLISKTSCLLRNPETSLTIPS